MQKAKRAVLMTPNGIKWLVPLADVKWSKYLRAAGARLVEVR